MKRSSSPARFLFVLALLLTAGLSADVVLHPGTLTGMIGLSGWTPSSSSISLSNSAFFGQTGAAADGSFSLTLEGDQTYTSENEVFYFNAGSVYLSVNDSQSVTVPVGGSASIDLRRPGATVTASLTIAGGTLVNWTPSIYGSGSGVSFNIFGGSTSIFSLPVVAGLPYTLSGTVLVNVSDSAGGTLCTVSTPISTFTQAAPLEGQTDTVAQSISVDASACASGISGTAGFTNLPADHHIADASLNLYSTAGSKTLTWSNQDSYPFAFTVAPGHYWLSGWVRFFGGSFMYLPNRELDVTAGAITPFDYSFDAALVTGGLAVTSPLGPPDRLGRELAGTYDPSLPNGGPTVGSVDYTDLGADGHYGAVVYPGKWSPWIFGSYYGLVGGQGSEYFYCVDYAESAVTATAGAPVSIPDEKLAFSAGTIVFDVAEPPGSPEVGISNPSVTAFLSDSNHYCQIGSSTYLANAPSPSVQLVGIPGRYHFDAYATVQGAYVRFASSTIDLGEAVDTPPGTDVTIVPKDSSGQPTPIQIDFKTVTTGGTTTVSTTDVGPAAPQDYDLLALIDGKKYVNINTSAQFPGKLEIAFKYDASALGLAPWQEQRLVLQQYICDSNSACTWVPINEVYNPHNPTYTDADARYFGRSNLPNPDAANHVIYGVTTSLGTFGLTYPKVVLVPPTDTCIGTAAAPAQLTTDAAVCSATVDNVNQRAGGCSGGGGGLASCLFDGAGSEALGLGAHSVGIAGTAVDGSTASCTSYVTVADREPPAIACQAPVTMECTGPQTPYTASATCGDNCGACTASCGSGPFAVGTTPVSCNANDTAGNKNSCQTSVTVVDTRAPALTLNASPKTLWPPNHKMVPIAVATTTSDRCDPAPAVTCTATSSEPALDNKSPDIVWSNGQLSLRAERNGNGPGRTYTITCTSADQSGNKTVQTAQVLVPHDQSK